MTYADAMNKPLDFRPWWSKYGVWTTLFFYLEAYWLFGLACVTWWQALLIPLSLTLSAMTFVRLLGDCWRPARFWTPYVVKWLSWLIANLIGFFFLVCMITSIFSLYWNGSFYVVLPFILLPPILRLFVHIRRDIRDIRAVNAASGSVGYPRSISHAAPIRVGGRESFTP